MSSQDAALREQLQALYADNHSWLYSWLCKKLGCVYNAEDMAQNTFLRLFSLTSLEQIREPKAFLTTTASRLMIDETRRKAVEQRYLETYTYYHGEEAVMPSAEELALIAEKLAQVIQMLEGLPEKCQRAFVMSKFDGMQYDEIALALGVSKSRVQQYITRVKLAYYELSYDA